MKTEFYSLRLIMLILSITIIPFILAKVVEVHIPSKEEINYSHHINSNYNENDIERPFIGIDQRSEEEKIFDDERHVKFYTLEEEEKNEFKNN